MKGKSKWWLFEIIGKPYALDILEALSESPKRYSDLKNACFIDKTRIKRLRELKKANLIDVVQKPFNNRIFLHYKITPNGEKIIQVLKSLI